MEFTDYLYDEVKDIWNGYLQHPFIKELGQGCLNREKFKNYLIEDYLYLKEYTKAFALGITKAEKMDEIKFFYKTIKGILEDENAVHIKYLTEFGVDLEEIDKRHCELANSSYTSYMMKIAIEGNLREIAVATMPCGWSYYYIGEHIKRNLKNENNFYLDWINAYSCEEYFNSVKEWKIYINKITENISDDEKRKLIHIFKRASEHEMNFWDMAYNG